MKTFDLKPCPFCCESPQCFVMPATSMLMGHSMEEAAYAWNSRSDNA